MMKNKLPLKKSYSYLKLNLVCRFIFYTFNDDSINVHAVKESWSFLFKQIELRFGKLTSVFSSTVEVILTFSIFAYDSFTARFKHTWEHSYKLSKNFQDNEKFLIEVLIDIKLKYLLLNIKILLSLVIQSSSLLNPTIHFLNTWFQFLNPCCWLKSTNMFSNCPLPQLLDLDGFIDSASLHLGKLEILQSIIISNFIRSSFMINGLELYVFKLFFAYIN